MRQRLLATLAIAAGVAALAWAFGAWKAALPVALIVAGLTAFVAWALPQVGVAVLDRAVDLLRAYHWRREQGRHHAFGGVPLAVEDDGRHVWVSGADLQRVLGTRDADDVLAARHSGRWRRCADGTLQLRVDAVVDHLARAPGRFDPRTVRLRRYFERELLYPAAERRRRARPS